MAPSFVTIDTTADFDMSAAAPKMNGSTHRTLLLAPPSIATQEEKLRDLFTTFDRSTTDLQMLDRVSAGLVSLPSDTYDLVLILTDTDGTRRSEVLQFMTRNVYSALVPSMKAGGKLQTQDSNIDASLVMEAVLAGLVKTDGGFQKISFDTVAAIPLRRTAKKEGAKAPANITVNQQDDLEDEDELIDEDTLLTEEDMTNPIIQPPECQPKPGRRRRACKDCTCGLASRMEKEDETKRAAADKDLNVLKLESDDLNELDFTVKGKTGSCGSCSLGDAFRCDGCPYIGLPAFKPGQEVQILNDMAQL